MSVAPLDNPASAPRPAGRAALALLGAAALVLLAIPFPGRELELPLPGAGAGNVPPQLGWLVHFALAFAAASLLPLARPLGNARAGLGLGLGAAALALAGLAAGMARPLFSSSAGANVTGWLAHVLGLLAASLIAGAYIASLRVILRADSRPLDADPQAADAGAAPGVSDPNASGADVEPAAESDAATARSAPDKLASAKPASTKPAARSFLGNAMTVSGLTFLSRITGLARDSYLAGAFGLGGISDAFKMGFQAPNLFRRLFGEGALTAAFIPVYTDLLTQDPALARRFASFCLASTAIALGLLTVVAELVLLALLHGHAWTPDTALAIRLIMVMLPYMPAVCLVALFGSMLQVHGRFAPSAGMPILLNVVMVVGTWLALRLGRSDDDSLRSAAYIVGVSVVVAGVVQLFTQGGALLQYFRFTSSFEGIRPAVTTMLKTFFPMLLALAVFQVNTFLDSLIAFALSPKAGGEESLHILGWTAAYPVDSGGMTALTNAQLLYQFPLGVFGLAIATAIFPALAHAAAVRGEAGRLEFRQTLQQGLRLTVFIGLPASVGLILVRLPLTRVLYEHSRFTLDDSTRVAAILTGFAPAIWAYSMTHVITRAFYALKDSTTPLVVSVFMVLLNLTLNLILVWPLGAAGLAWSTAVCAAIQCVILLLALRHYMGNPVDRSVLAGWGRSALLSAAMALALLPCVLMVDAAHIPRWRCAALLAAMVALGGLVYLGGAYLLHAEELASLRRRRRRSSSTAP
ncbi:MAG: murein biosynthesis integral membrane protein MurJ [Planctomycetota bacterium]|nr:murein biosynthesis integral membrane protein MurJ [Planctomycetota bacterium]